jgi:hypothetical protein
LTLAITLAAAWGNATVVAILDHHEDRGGAPMANPRVIEPAGSCTSLVTRYMFERLDSVKKDGAQVLHGKLPTELAELMLRTSESSKRFILSMADPHLLLLHYSRHRQFGTQEGAAPTRRQGVGQGSL